MHCVARILLVAGLLGTGCGGSPDATDDGGVDAMDGVPDEGDVAEEPPASDAECQPAGDVTVSLTTYPYMDEGTFTESGTVESIDASDPDSASFTVHLPAVTGFARDQTYTVPVTHGDLVDLAVGDEVDVRYEKERWGEWIQTDLHVARGGTTILYYMDCTNYCSFMNVVTSPVSVETLTGACAPEEDVMGCAMVERTGYRMTCAPSPDPVDVFDHDQATIACDAGYLVIVEDHVAVTEHLMPCSGVADDRIEVLFLRLE